jgi:nitrite reductase (NO-forming)
MLWAFCLPALLWLAAGAVVAAVASAGLAGPRASWLAVHLIFVGGISQVLIGAGQFFSSAYLATEPPPRRTTRAQSVSWNAGALLVAIGLPSGAGGLTAAGGGLLLAGLALYTAALRRLERDSLQRARWAVRWYYGSAAFLATGSLLGATLATGAGWTHGSLFAAHITCNLAGWFGGAIIGTLHTFFPTLTNGRLEHPRLQGPAFMLWYGGVAAFAAGEAFAAAPLAWSGAAAIAAAAALLCVNLAASARAARGPVGLPARLIGAAQGFLIAGIVVACWMLIAAGPLALTSDPWRSALGVLLGIGWIGMTFAGSLVHLLGVLARVRGGAPPMRPKPRRDGALTAALALAVALLAAAQDHALAELRTGAAALVFLLALPLAARIARLAAGALRATRPVTPGM